MCFLAWLSLVFDAHKSKAMVGLYKANRLLTLTALARVTSSDYSYVSTPVPSPPLLRMTIFLLNSLVADVYMHVYIYEKYANL